MKPKDKKIEILAVIHGKDPEGFTIDTLTPIAPPLWAYYRQLSGKEIYAAASVQAVEDAMFIINWRDGVTTRHVIRYKGAEYDITRVDMFEGYKGDMTLYAKRRV
jgi:SPP1 family predicted phage head-tail adaptor